MRAHVDRESTRPSRPLPSEPEVNKLFRMVMKHKGSDLHLKVGPPAMRLARGHPADGNAAAHPGGHGTAAVPAPDAPASRTILDEEGRDRLRPHRLRGDDECRFRVNLFKQRGRLSLVARRVNNKIPSFEDLGLPGGHREITQYDQGIVILAGVTGSGKSTTIASMLDYINERERLHILTIEDPIEFTFTDDKALINQREVGIDVIDWHKALKHAVRQDPDIILVGEMRDRETFRPRCTRPRRATWCSARSTPAPPRRPSAEYSTCSPATCTRRSASRWRSTSRRSSPRSCCRPSRNGAKGTSGCRRTRSCRQPDRPQADPERGGQQAPRRHPDRQGRRDDGLHREPQQLVDAEKIDKAMAFEFAPNPRL